MTTAVRIEKSDCNNSVQVRVRQQQRSKIDGVDTWVDSPGAPIDLYSCQITSSLMVCSTNRYIIEEITP